MAHARGHELRRRVEPLKAVGAMRHLIADKEDTAQVFRVVKALSGNCYFHNFNRFMNSANGRRIASDRADLLETLCDRKRLATCASGTLARAYLDFVYGEGLSAEGLAQASEAGGLEDFSDPDVSLYRRRLRDAHDLFHVVTGYGRDALGELCVLSFGNAQFYNHGIAFIVGVGIPKMKLEASQLPVARAAFEAWRRGRAAADLTTFYWEENLDRPLEEVRRELKLRPPETYLRVRALSEQVERDYQAVRQA
ncbi:Coq4 family protein [Erythrobacter sp.]|uniref:Coq4 family protein n=1 Tax=Erythrobacter sp. TaxID=1042 RepID=UPI0025BAC28B|nr:Coq4 family protein [Erythrobacter sp.]